MTVWQDTQRNPESPSRRERLIELLVFARDKIQGMLELESCPHAGWLAEEDALCQRCSANCECSWLMHNDGVLPWFERSDDDLLRALRFALEILSGYARSGEHEVQSCSCEACAWLRSVRRSLAHRA